MSFTRTQYEQAAQKFFQQNPQQFERYFSPTLLQTIVGAMQSSLPTVTAAKIAFDRLVTNGTLQRTDGRTYRDDCVEAVAVAEANAEKAAAEVSARPLSKDELELFASLSNRDLADKYWAHDGHNEFRIRYDRAVREHLFRVPSRPQALEVQSADAELTAEQYYAMPSRELQVKLRSPIFKLRIMQMIKSGAIR